MHRNYKLRQRRDSWHGINLNNITGFFHMKSHKLKN